ncbi:MAG TPA: hypothetical protein VLX92_27295 [Kofleriaceae bacterium]|nr:hypothetical protein [Kofleriaceae bacterium]
MPDDLQIRLALEQRREPEAEQRVVIDEENASRPDAASRWILASRHAVLPDELNVPPRARTWQGSSGQFADVHESPGSTA